MTNLYFCLLTIIFASLGFIAGMVLHEITKPLHSPGNDRVAKDGVRRGTITKHQEWMDWADNQ